MRRTLHGFNTTDRIYRIWAAMKNRCSNPKNSEYKNYGARGITVCGSWRADPMVFRRWALTNNYADNLYLDRRDTNLGYYPENCRWLTPAASCRNRRVVLLTFEKAELIRGLYAAGCTPKEIAEYMGLHRSTVGNVIYKNNWAEPAEY